ncbi:MAG: hypothetical protein WCJ09_27185 [Planctomycetota bacterium]
MNAVGIEIRRFVDDSQPGYVECWLTDANGREWSFVEKVPVVTAEDLDAESDYPRPGIIACEVIGREIGTDEREVVVIDTDLPWGVEATTGETRFVVLPEQLQQWD